MSSGSDTRRRTKVLPCRLLPEEAAEIKEKAQASGVPVSEFLRSAALGRRARSRADERLLNELRRQGGLLKLLSAQNRGRWTHECDAVVGEIRELLKRVGDDAR